jgi:predicted nucleotidyltransferase
MEFEFSEKRIKFSRELSDLDTFVLDFVKILDSVKIKYIIISGYVAILFGRSRTTEDIDMFIEDVDKARFNEILERLEKSGLWVINTSDGSKAYTMLKEGDAIRIAKKNMAIPNIEIKIKKDENVWKDNIEVILNDSRLVTSRLESQIAFKLYLGSEKDIEDAVHLYEIFKEHIDKKFLAEKCKELNVLGAMNKYVR